MTWEAWTALALLIGILYALARNLVRADVVFMGGVAVLITLSLFSDRFPTPAQAAATFGNEGLLTLGILLVVAAGLTETGARRVVTKRFLGRPGSVASAQLRMMLPVVSFSAILNNTPLVATFIPIIQDWTRPIGISRSKLLIPLNSVAVLGGACTLMGTSTNLVVSGVIERGAPNRPQHPDVRQVHAVTYWRVGCAVRLGVCGAGVCPTVSRPQVGWVAIAERARVCGRNGSRALECDRRADH